MRIQISNRVLSCLTFLIVLCCSILLICKFKVTSGGLQLDSNTFLFQKRRTILNDSGVRELLSAGCQLVKRNPWEESILDVFDPLWGYKEQCNSTKLRTTLRDNKIINVEENDNCWGRCLKRISASQFANGTWQTGTFIFKCDIVEVRCSRTPNIQEYDYIWVHTQIYEKENIKNKLSPYGNYTYDVFLLVLDSTAHTQSNRNLPKTINYLTKSLNGVEFPFLNRVAMNSMPNSLSLFLGEIAERVDRDIIGLPSEEPSRTSVDPSTLIHKEFAKNGYVTAFYEDYSGEFYGIKNGFTTHDNVPFRRFWLEPYKQLKEMKINNSCVTDHQIIFEHAAQFMNSYKGIPKFLTVWDTNFGHQSTSESIAADTILYNFFIKNRKNLKNSFIIVMGDHGLRVQEGKTTKLGRYEINNPMLIVVPPKDLTNNEELMEILKENSQKLQTHHDTRHTLLDILKYQPAVAYTDREPLDTSLRGSSYLRKQTGDRNCLTLPIPFQYCICNQEYEDLDRTSVFAQIIGEFIASEINNRLKKFRIFTKCNKWKFKQLTVFRRLKNIVHIDVYEVEGTYEPNAGFTTMIGNFRDGILQMGALDRTDMYRDRGRCIDDPFKWPICDCIEKQGKSN